MAFDPVTTLNLLLSIIILVLGYFDYARGRHKIAFYIGLAFTCFALSHLMVLLQISFTEGLIAIRTLGYLTVVYALVQDLRYVLQPKTK